MAQIWDLGLRAKGLGFVCIYVYIEGLRLMLPLYVYVAIKNKGSCTRGTEFKFLSFQPVFVAGSKGPTPLLCPKLNSVLLLPPYS